MEMFIIVIYAIAAYWAVGQTIYANKIRIGTYKDLFFTQLIIGIFLGFILIPVAIIKKFLFK